MDKNEKMNFLREAIQTLFPKISVSGLQESSVLLDMGLDSLDIVELQMYYEEKTNTQINESNVAIVTVSDLLNLMP